MEDTQSLWKTGTNEIIKVKLLIPGTIVSKLVLFITFQDIRVYFGGQRPVVQD